MHKHTPTHPDIIAEIEAICAAHGISHRRFGLIATNDAGLHSKLLRGRELRRATLSRVRATLDGLMAATADE